MKGAKYNKVTGEIVAVIGATTALELAAQATDDFGIVPCADNVNGMTFWVHNGLPEERQPSGAVLVTPIVDVDETIKITGLPEHCWLFDSIRMNDIEVSGGTFQTSTSEEGEVFIRLIGPYSGAFTIQVTALAKFKNESLLFIDAAAEEARSRVVTAGSGQAMTYIRKADAARMFLAGQELSDAQMLRIEDEATRLGVSKEEAATTLVQTADAWETLDASIDNIRLTTKALITEADSTAKIIEIIEQTVWPV